MVMGMRKVKAREKLELMEVGDYPNLKKTDRRNIHKRVTKQSQTEDGQASRAVKTEDLQAVYGDFGSIESVIKGK